MFLRRLLLPLVKQGALRQRLARVQRLRPELGRQFRLVQEVNRAVCHRQQNRLPRARRRRRPEPQQAYRLHHLSEANNGQDLADDLSPERLLAPRAHPSGRRFNPSDHRRHRLSRVNRKQAGLPRPPNPDRLVAPRTLLSEGAAKVSELNVAGHHHQPVPVRVSVAAGLSEAHRATANLARHLGVQGPPRREAEKSADNQAPKNLQLRRLPVQVRAKRQADHREGKVPMVSLPGSQRVEQHQLRLSKGRENLQRKKEKGLHRRGRSKILAQLP
jgi:hypothetical protein